MPITKALRLSVRRVRRPCNPRLQLQCGTRAGKGGDRRVAGGGLRIDPRRRRTTRCIRPPTCTVWPRSGSVRPVPPPPGRCCWSPVRAAGGRRPGRRLGRSLPGRPVHLRLGQRRGRAELKAIQEAATPPAVIEGQTAAAKPCRRSRRCRRPAARPDGWSPSQRHRPSPTAEPMRVSTIFLPSRHTASQSGDTGAGSSERQHQRARSWACQLCSRNRLSGSTSAGPESRAALSICAAAC